MCIYIYICIYATYTYMHICTYIHICIHIHIHIYVIYVYIYICIYARDYAHRRRTPPPTVLASDKVILLYVLSSCSTICKYCSSILQHMIVYAIVAYSMYIHINTTLYSGLIYQVDWMQVYWMYSYYNLWILLSSTAGGRHLRPRWHRGHRIM